MDTVVLTINFATQSVKMKEAVLQLREFDIRAQFN